MGFKIGFSAEDSLKEQKTETEIALPEAAGKPRRSLVQVSFPDRNTPLAYYNDRFDLHCGDIVFVDGKLEGKRGRVTGVNYNFCIRLLDYKRVIAVADTSVHGTLYFGGSHLIAFDRSVLPREKVAGWFKAPPKPEDEFVSCRDDSAFPLKNMVQMGAGPEVAERGRSYYVANQVRYICLDGTRGYALVEGKQPYDVEFSYAGGDISALTCSCYCAGVCKHEIAAMLQLREILNFTEEHYAGEFAASGYFAAVFKGTFFTFAVDSRESGTLIV